MHIDTKIKCVKSEIKRRKKYFPMLVRGGKMKQADADQEIQSMISVLETLTQLRGMV